MHPACDAWRKLLKEVIFPIGSTWCNYYVPSYTHTLHMTLQYDPVVALVPVVPVAAVAV